MTTTRSTEQRIRQAHRRREQFRAQRTAKRRLRLAHEDDEAVIYIYDFIDFLGVSPDELVPMLAEITEPTIRVRINSPGGDVFDGFTIYNALRQHGARVITQVDGLAASAASVVAMAGNEVQMGDASFLMIHNAWGLTVGNAADLRDTAELLDKIDQQIAEVYARKGEGTAAAFLDAMAEETWYTTEEAIEAGLADTTVDTEPVQNHFDLSVYKHPPQALRDVKPVALTESVALRQMEEVLRDVGLSQSEAKKLLADGASALGLRDVDLSRAEEVTALVALATDLRGPSKVTNALVT